MKSFVLFSIPLIASGLILGCSDNSDEAAARTRDSLEAVVARAQAEAADARLHAERIRAEEEAKRNDPAYQRALLQKNEERDWKALLLVSDVEWKDPLFGRPFVKATLMNTATMASFKDIECEVRFFSKTRAVLGRTKRVCYDYLYPDGRISVKFEDLKIPKATESIDVRVVKVAITEQPGC
jgi:hypothetical protein